MARSNGTRSQDKAPKLLEQVREVIRTRHYSLRVRDHRAGPVAEAGPSAWGLSLHEPVPLDLVSSRRSTPSSRLPWWSAAWRGHGTPAGVHPSPLALALRATGLGTPPQRPSTPLCPPCRTPCPSSARGWKRWRHAAHRRPRRPTGPRPQTRQTSTLATTPHAAESGGETGPSGPASGACPSHDRPGPAPCAVAVWPHDVCPAEAVPPPPGAGAAPAHAGGDALGAASRRVAGLRALAHHPGARRACPGVGPPGAGLAGRAGWGLWQRAAYGAALVCVRLAGASQLGSDPARAGPCGPGERPARHSAGAAGAARGGHRPC